VLVAGAVVLSGAGILPKLLMILHKRLLAQNKVAACGILLVFFLLPDSKKNI
jgi:hypothetical protein